MSRGGYIIASYRQAHVKEGSKPLLNAVVDNDKNKFSCIYDAAIYILRQSHITPGTPLGFSRVIVALPCTCIIKQL